MLNRFRIGTKLFGGFAIVLVLLAFVWGTGWYATSQIVKMTQEVDLASTLSQKGLKMQKEILTGMLATTNESLYREERYANEVKRIVAHIKTEYGEMDKAINDPDAKKAFKDVMEQVDKFAESDANYWKKEVEQEQMVAARTASALKVVDDVGALIDNVYQMTIKNFAKPHADDNKQYVPVERIDMINKAAILASEVRDMRRLCFQYDSALKEEIKIELKKGLEQTYAHCKKELEELTPILQTKEGQEIIADFSKNMATFWDLQTKLIEATDQLLAIDGETAKICEAMTATIDTMLGVFDARSNAALKNAQAMGTQMRRLLMVISISAIVFGVFVSWALTANIASALVRAAGAMKIIADDGVVNFDIPDADMNRQDEVGNLALGVDAILKQFQNVERLAIGLADGNYNVETKVRGDQDTMNINLNKMLDQVNQALHEIDDSVRQVATGSGEVSAAAQNLSNGAQEAAASLEEITASMSEISSQTKMNAESAAQARDLAQQATKAAGDGQTAMREMTTAMEHITKNSDEIQRVIKVIDDIAFQTNLLALNAAVEAARAGQHGKGFAVVAEEVRNLAARSAKAARETSELIAKSGQEIIKGGEVATHTATVLNTIVTQVKQTTDLVAGIAVASNEQAQGVAQVTVGLQQIDAVTQQNTASAEESASAANEMSGMAASLQQLVAQFKLRG